MCVHASIADFLLFRLRVFELVLVAYRVSRELDRLVLAELLEHAHETVGGGDLEDSV